MVFVKLDIYFIGERGEVQMVTGHTANHCNFHPHLHVYVGNCACQSHSGNVKLYGDAKDKVSYVQHPQASTVNKV